MDFSTPQEETMLRESIRKVCAEFSDDYWMRHDNDSEFPQEFFDALATAGFVGMCTPEEYGGGGADVTAASILMEEIAASGGANSASSVIVLNLFGLEPVINFGSDEMKKEFLTRNAKGDLHVCFGVTEPDSGTDTTRITTFAKKVPGGYKVNGQKVWISNAQKAERALLLTRTSPRTDSNPTAGMTLFFTELDREHVEIKEIPKLGTRAVESNFLFIDDLFVPDEDLVGEEGDGFRCLLGSLNVERILMSSMCLGIGRAALRKTSTYAKEREVFGRPIGMNQGIQFPLADSLAKLDAAELVTRKAAWLYDNGQPCGREANTAKLLCSEAGCEACDRAIQFHGGYGYAKEYHVERYWRDIRMLRIAPIANELVLAYLATKVLGMPRSY